MVSKSEMMVVILAGGIGNRLKPLSEKIIKPLMPIGPLPIIHQIINNYLRSKFSKFLILTGYKSELITKYFLKFPEILINYAYQPKQVGMADAILISAEFIKKNLSTNGKFEFFVSASDILLSAKQINLLYDFYCKSNADIVLSLMKSFDYRLAKGHGNVGFENILSDNNDFKTRLGLKIGKIIEKPKRENVLSPYYSLPVYIFNHKIVSYLKKVKESIRGEKELQDAIQIAINKGEIVQGINIFKKDLNLEEMGEFHLTYLKDLIKMNLKFLESFKSNKSMIGDNVKTGKNVKFDLCLIHENCEIGDFGEFNNSIFFKNVKIGVNAKLDTCIVIENTKLPDNYKGKNLLIMQNSKGILEVEEIK